CTPCGGSGQVCCPGMSCAAGSVCSVSTGKCAACGSAQHVCSNACVANNSTQTCGTTSCSPCPTVANGQPSCDGTGCGFTCDAQAMRCNPGKDACEKTLWTFEGSGIDGWSSPSASDKADDSGLTQSTTRAHGGQKSMTAHLSVSPTTYAFRLNFFPCG